LGERAGAIVTGDGRSLAYLEVGDPDGPLVVHSYGGPGSRLEARLLADSAAKNRLRLVCLARPGVVQSSRQKHRSYAGCLDDKLVSDPINKAVAAAMPGAVWHPVEGAGHFVAIGSGDDIFAIAAKELRP
jgi:pimeloyl-ACP methyl ester carboxylesterase